MSKTFNEPIFVEKAVDQRLEDCIKKLLKEDISGYLITEINREIKVRVMDDFEDVDLDWAGYDWDRRHGYVQGPCEQQRSDVHLETDGPEIMRSSDGTTTTPGVALAPSAGKENLSSPR